MLYCARVAQCGPAGSARQRPRCHGNAAVAYCPALLYHLRRCVRLTLGQRRPVCQINVGPASSDAGPTLIWHTAPCYENSDKLVRGLPVWCMGSTMHDCCSWCENLFSSNSGANVAKKAAPGCDKGGISCEDSVQISCYGGVVTLSFEVSPC